MKRERDERYREVNGYASIKKLVPQINTDVCRGVLGEWYLNKQAASSSLLVEEDSDTGDLKAALFFTDGGWVPYITMCALPGHGRAMFNEFVSRFNPSEIEIDSIPSAVGFWRKLGFRVREDCESKEDETVGRVLDQFTSEPFDSTDPDEDEGLQEFMYLVQPHFDEDEMEDFIYSEEQRIAYKWLDDFRSDEGLKMRWCKPQ